MKVISIMQPWASLIALGEKKFETRSWRTNYRGELAIHASKKIDRTACKMTPIVQTLNKHSIVLLNDLPTGMIIATCNLEGCYEVMTEDGESAILEGWNKFVFDNEYNFGDFSEGRFAWELSNIRTLNKPIQAKGQLGLWNFKEGLIMNE
nr:ASCH domain-containing protein [Bacillus sp. CGMCC 1.16541]